MFLDTHALVLVPAFLVRRIHRPLGIIGRLRGPGQRRCMQWCRETEAGSLLLSWQLSGTSAC